LRCELFLQETAYSDDWYLNSGNVLLDRLFGANLHFIDRDRDLYDAMVEHAGWLSDEGHNPYVIPYGGSNPLGAIGYALAGEEILTQCRESDINPDAIFAALGSGGTQAGLAAGLGAESDVRVVGVAVAPDAVSDEEVAALAEETAALLGDRGVAPLAFDWNQAGTPYGIPTEESTAAIGLLARLEGVLIEPVYTSKAMAAMISWIESERLGDSTDVIFVHTGGGPGLFAYQNHLDAWLSETSSQDERALTAY
jgi:1-aminocyclopropane-1-carboxylate deaminase/D-cysteine desulfhydrase-like pyridoxal-dependent ACC family enzyme